MERVTVFSESRDRCVIGWNSFAEPSLTESYGYAAGLRHPQVRGFRNRRRRAGIAPQRNTHQAAAAAIKVLVLLATRAGRPVTREDIRQHLWGEDTFVDFDQGMNFCIKQIREALKDTAGRPVYIETLPRRGTGFAFLSP